MELTPSGNLRGVVALNAVGREALRIIGRRSPDQGAVVAPGWTSGRPASQLHVQVGATHLAMDVASDGVGADRLIGLGRNLNEH